MSVVLPKLYALSSDFQQMILENHPGPQVAMDSGANSFMFTSLQFQGPTVGTFPLSLCLRMLDVFMISTVQLVSVG